MIPGYMLKIGAAGVAGSLQPFILKKFILPVTETPHIEGLPGTMGSASFLVNTALAIGAIGLAAYGAYARKGPLADSELQEIALAYGIPAFVVGVAIHYQGTYQVTSRQPQAISFQAVSPSMSMGMGMGMVSAGPPVQMSIITVPSIEHEYTPVF